MENLWRSFVHPHNEEYFS